MDVQGLVTTLNNRGIGSSFKNSFGKSYFISTVNQQGYFETIIKERGISLNIQPILCLTGSNSIDGVMNHIALTLMCVTEDQDSWKMDAVVAFKPDKLKNLLDAKMQAPPNDAPLLNSYNHALLVMAGVNYSTKRPPLGLIIILCTVVGIVYGMCKLFI